MDEQKYEMHFQLIALAGQSKSNSVEAIREAREGNYEAAETLLKEAEEQFAEAHSLHFNMLQNEASSEKTEMDLIAVHAQDHVTMATVLHDVAADIVSLYRMVRGK